MKYILYCLLAFVSITSFSQTKTLTIEDAVLGQRTYLAPKKLNQLQWIKGTNKFSYVEVQGRREVVMSGEVGKPQRDALFANDLVAAKLTEYGVDSFTNFPPFTWIDSNTIQFQFKSKFVWFNYYEKFVRTSGAMDAGAENIDIEPAQRQVAYTVGNNLMIMGKGSARITVSSDPDKGHVYGSSNVHRNEYGISKGTFWSPKGSFLAYYRMDESMVTEYPILNIEDRPATARMIRYPMAGMKSHEVTVGIYDLSSLTNHYLNIAGDKEHYITNISWSRDESKIYLALLNRRTDTCWYQIYDVKSGNLIKTWATFTAPTYAEPLFPLQYMGNSNKLIWRTYELAADKKTTVEVIKIIDEDGNIITNQGFKYGDAIIETYAFDDKGYFFIYTSNNGLDKNLAYHSLTGKGDGVTTRSLRMQTVLFNDNGKYFIDQLQNSQTPRSILLRDASNGRPMEHLLDAENPLKDYKMPTAKLFTIKAADGKTDLNCRMIIPYDFDSAKKYPSITYVYNGPHVQLITNSWLGGADMWLYYMAQKGYIVFTVDGRGSGNRGKAFEQVIYRNLGANEIADQLKGNDYLRSLRYIDTTRMGVYGWSFGGFMTTSLMTRTPGKYKTAVAGGAVIDWSYYEIMYTERYMDTPDENPEGYAANNLLNYVDNLKGKLMLIHGTEDPVVVWQNTLMYLKKCVDHRKQVDYFVYPGHEHNVLGRDRVHLMQKVTDYFDQNL
jgi:dipeptidyl-peptidase-4